MIRSACVVLYAGLIFFLSSQPDPFPYLKRMHKYHLDWFVHGVEYLFFSMLVFRAALAHAPRADLRLLLWVSFLAASFYGLTDEWHQSFVAGRESSIWDWAADTVGAAAGSIIYFGWQRKKEGTSHG